MAYISHANADTEPSTFHNIARSSRARNRERGVSGVLLFDGSRFFQWLCGPRRAVTELMGDILLDSRHHDIAIRFEQILPALTFQPHWRAGSVDAAVLDQFALIEPDKGMLVLTGMAQLILRADLDRPES